MIQLIIVFLVCENDGTSSIEGKLASIQYSGSEFNNLCGPLSNLRDKLRSMIE